MSGGGEAKQQPNNKPLNQSVQQPANHPTSQPLAIEMHTENLTQLKQKQDKVYPLTSNSIDEAFFFFRFFFVSALFLLMFNA